MRITPIHITPSNFYPKTRQERLPERNGDTFSLQNPAQEISFEGSSKFTRAIRRAFLPKTIKRDAKIHHYLAAKMKHYCDFYYGRNNYTTISVGRSMASINETVGRMRRDTVCLPLSGLAEELPTNIQHIETYRKFLESKGLTKEIIAANPDRHYVLVDNFITGESLMNAKKLLSREDLLGNPDRFEILSAQEIFGADYHDMELDRLFLYSRFHRYSPVGALDVSNLSEVFNQADLKTLSQFETKWDLYKKKMFDFAIIDRIQRKPKRNR